MAANGDDSIVNLTGKWGKLTLTIFSFIALLGVVSLTFIAWGNVNSQKEHEQMRCLIKLALYLQGQPADRPVDWQKMPIDTFNCVPRFVYERDQTRVNK